MPKKAGWGKKESKIGSKQKTNKIVDLNPNLLVMLFKVNSPHVPMTRHLINQDD